MGIIADDVSDVLAQTKNTMAGTMTDIRRAKAIELLTGANGVVWVNVDGICLLRIHRCETVLVDTTNALSTDRVYGEPVKAKPDNLASYRPDTSNIDVPK